MIIVGVTSVAVLACIASYLIGHAVGRRQGAEEMDALYKGIAREIRRGAKP